MRFAGSLVWGPEVVGLYAGALLASHIIPLRFKTNSILIHFSVLLNSSTRIYVESRKNINCKESWQMLAFDWVKYDFYNPLQLAVS